MEIGKRITMVMGGCLVVLGVVLGVVMVLVVLLGVVVLSGVMGMVPTRNRSWLKMSDWREPPPIYPLRCDTIT